METIKYSVKSYTLRINLLFSLIFFALFSTILTAQKGNMRTTITGSVVDASLYPVSDAIVLLDGQKSKAITNSDGKYKVWVKRNAEKIGILTLRNGLIEVPIDGMTRINFQLSTNVIEKPLELNNDPGEEEVNIGYNSIKKKHLTTQSKKIDGSDRKFVPYSNIYEMIREEVAGVRVNGSEIIIHGADYYLSPVPPLLLVDGVCVNSLSTIPPSCVESIVVLKSAAAAVYGTRGYGGAILVTTAR